MMNTGKKVTFCVLMHQMSKSLGGQDENCVKTKKIRLLMPFPQRFDTLPTLQSVRATLRQHLQIACHFPAHVYIQDSVVKKIEAIVDEKTWQTVVTTEILLNNSEVIYLLVSPKHRFKAESHPSLDLRSFDFDSSDQVWLEMPSQQCQSSQALLQFCFDSSDAIEEKPAVAWVKSLTSSPALDVDDPSKKSEGIAPIAEDLNVLDLSSRKRQRDGSVSLGGTGTASEHLVKDVESEAPIRKKAKSVDLVNNHPINCVGMGEKVDVSTSNSVESKSVEASRQSLNTPAATDTQVIDNYCSNGCLREKVVENILKRILKERFDELWTDMSQTLEKQVEFLASQKQESIRESLETYACKVRLGVKSDVLTVMKEQLQSGQKELREVLDEALKDLFLLKKITTQLLQVLKSISTFNCDMDKLSELLEVIHQKQNIEAFLQNQNHANGSKPNFKSENSGGENQHDCQKTPSRILPVDQVTPDRYEKLIVDPSSLGRRYKGQSGGSSLDKSSVQSSASSESSLGSYTSDGQKILRGKNVSRRLFEKDF